jgi:putative hydrolase of the HAD superfamily
MTPEAVLLDVGGVFLLPTHDRVVAAFERAGCPVSPDILDRAHYVAATAFTTELDALDDWAACWHVYLDAYVEACGVDPAVPRDEVHRHLDSEFADAALWLEPVAGARQGVGALAETGVKLGIVSNADGVMGERLRRLEIVQVGPGVGVEVGCVIDSGAVGFLKPDPRIFQLALDALDVSDPVDTWYVGDIPGIDVVGARRAGMRAICMDPLGLHHDAGYDRVASLAEVAEWVRSAIDGGSSASASSDHTITHADDSPARSNAS